MNATALGSLTVAKKIDIAAKEAESNSACTSSLKAIHLLAEFDMIWALVYVSIHLYSDLM